MAAAIAITSTTLFAQEDLTADTVIATVDGAEITPVSYTHLRAHET